MKLLNLKAIRRVRLHSPEKRSDTVGEPLSCAKAIQNWQLQGMKSAILSNFSPKT